MFAISIESIVGNGRDTLFWTDRWLHGCCLEDLAPEVVRCVPLRLRKKRTVSEALQRPLLGDRLEAHMGGLA